jgi:hypothetical protein
MSSSKSPAFLAKPSWGKLATNGRTLLERRDHAFERDHAVTAPKKISDEVPVECRIGLSERATSAQQLHEEKHYRNAFDVRVRLSPK